MELLTVPLITLLAEELLDIHMHGQQQMELDWLLEMKINQV